MPLPLTDPRPKPPTRCCRLVYSGHYGGAPWVNVMWLYLTGSGVITIPNLNALADYCALQYKNYLLVNQSVTSELQSTSVFLYGDGDDVLEGISSNIYIGTETGGVDLPSNVALCISWKIAPSYRGGHPRTYVSGIRSNQVASVVSFEAVHLASWRSRAAQFHTNIEGFTGGGAGISTVEHGIVSFVRNKEWRTPPVFYRIVSSDVDGRIDSQRRRLGNDFP